MAIAQDLKNNCTSGELTPRLHRRSDIAQYKNGLATCLNALISPYGGAYRRFGTKYVAAAKNADKTVLLRKFEFSETQAYVLEFGEYYIRYYMESAQIVSGGSPVETTTTYTEAELRELRFEQSADVLYIFHKDHAPAKLSRTAHTSWTLEDVDFTGGPFLDDNETAITLAPSAVTGTGITISASASVFESGHVGSVWKLSSGKSVSEVTAGITSVTTSSAVTTGGETVEVEISGTWAATVTVERSFDNGTNWYSYLTFGDNAVKQFEDTRDVQYRVNVTAYTSGTVGVRLSVLDSEGTGQGTFRITAVASGTSCTATVIDEIRAIYSTTIWAEAAWSLKLGYPRAGKIYEGRLVMASTDSDPTGVWGSSSLDFEDMKLGTDDDDAFYFSLDAKGGVNVVKWMESWKHLGIGTLGGELRLVSDNGITPSNPPDKKQDSNYGSAEIQGFVAGRAIIFVDKSGRIVREYAYDYNTDTFDASSLTTLSEHIPNNGGGIVDTAYQQKQDSIIWFVLADGTLASLTYVPSQQVAGWARHRLGGIAAVESVCVIPGSTSGHDEVWFSVKRNIAGIGLVRYIEIMNEDEVGWLGELPAPTISPAAGTYAAYGFEVSMIAGGPLGDIRYTLDGSTPDRFSFLYDTPFNPLYAVAGSVDVVVTACMVHPDYADSDVDQKTYMRTLSTVYYYAANARYCLDPWTCYSCNDTWPMTIGKESVESIGAILFENVAINQGQQIYQAYLNFQTNSTWAQVLTVDVYFANADNASMPSNLYTSLPALTNPVVWSITAPWYVSTWYNTVDLKSALQEVVNRPGWVSGNDVLLVIKNHSGNTEHRRLYGNYYTSSKRPKLYVKL